MRAFGNSIAHLGLGAFVIAAATSAAVAGDAAPELAVGWTVDGISDSSTLAGTGMGLGLYTYSGVSTGDGYEINWSFLVTDNGASGGFEILASTLGITNTGVETSTFGIEVLLPVNLGPGSAFYGGSLGGSLTGGEFGGYLASIDDSTPMWTAMVDDGFLTSLGTTPFELTSSAFESADLAAESFGDPIPSLSHAAAQESMSIHLDFLLGAGSTFAITSNYVAQIPAPAGLALLGVAGLARRRRRD